MNSERNIIMKLKESKQLDEKTYTVGNTQYWKRNGKFYSWTSTGGRKEVSKNEYMKAMGQARSGMGSVQDTEPHEDKAKEINSPDPNLGKTVKLKGGREGTIKTIDDLSVEEKREGTFGTVTINGIKYDVYDSLWANGFASLVRHEEESKKEEPEKTSPTPSTGKKESDYQVTRMTPKEEDTAHDRFMQGDPARDIAFILANRNSTVSRLVNRDRDPKTGEGSVDRLMKKQDYRDYMDNMIEEWKADVQKALDDALANPNPPKNRFHTPQYFVNCKDYINKIAKKWEDYKQSTPVSDNEPRYEDPSESDHVNYKSVARFDHTTWDIDGEEATIQKLPQGGYYVQVDDYDLEFPTKGDLVKYLRDNDADYIGDDSENDY